MKNHHDPHNNPKRALNANYFFLAVDVLRSGRFASKRIIPTYFVGKMSWHSNSFAMTSRDVLCCGIM